MILVVNKVDRPDARIGEVVDEVYELFLDLDADEEQIEFPIVYTNAKAGWACTEEGVEGENLRPLFELILATVPAPDLRRGRTRSRRSSPTSTPRPTSAGSRSAACTRARSAAGRRWPGAAATASVEPVQGHRAVRDRGDGAGRTPTRPGPGEIIALAGLPEVMIGETIADRRGPRPLPPLTVDEPALGMTVGINTSPLAGQSGDKLTARLLQNRLEQELVGNVAIRGEHRPRGPTPGRCRAAASSSSRCSSRRCGARASS